MGFPNIVYAGYGDDKKTHSTSPGGSPLGQDMRLPDGRRYSLGRCGSGAALTAGVVVGNSAAVEGHGAIAGSGLLASATTTYNLSAQNLVYLTTKSVAVTKDQYADGYMNVQLSAGNAEIYKIKANDSAASASVVKFELEENLKTAFAAGSTAVGLMHSPFGELIPYSMGTVIGRPKGVTPCAVPISYYFWAQRGGPASVRTAATTLNVNGVVVCSSVTAGSVTVLVQATTGSASTTELNNYLSSKIGVAMDAPTAAEAAMVDLDLG